MDGALSARYGISELPQWSPDYKSPIYSGLYKGGWLLFYSPQQSKKSLKVILEKLVQESTRSFTLQTQNERSTAQELSVPFKLDIPIFFLKRTHRQCISWNAHDHKNKTLRAITGAYRPAPPPGINTLMLPLGSARGRLDRGLVPCRNYMM